MPNTRAREGAPSRLAALLAIGAAACAAREPSGGARDAEVQELEVRDAEALDGEGLAPADVSAPVAAACGDADELPPGFALAGDGRSIVAQCSSGALTLSVLEAGTVHLRYGAERRSPAVVWSAPPEVLRVGRRGARLAVCTDELTIEVAPEGCRVVARATDGTVLLDDGEAGGWSLGQDGVAEVARTTPPGERFYGFGEKTGPLDKRGRTMTFYNTDAYLPELGGYPPDADPLYQSIPFFIGLREGAGAPVAYGLFVDDPFRLVLDMGGSNPGEYRLRSSGGQLDQYLFAGPSIARVIERYTALTGRMPMPPRWALGYHQSRWGYSPDARVREVAAEFRARDIPADGLWLDIQHMDGFRSFTFDPATFSAPERLMRDLDALHFAPIAIVDPGLKVEPGWDVYDEGLAAGYYLSTPDGVPYVGEAWPGAVVFPDFSDARVRAWWSALLPRILDVGLRGLWIDLDEPANFLAGANDTVPDTLLAAGDGVPTTMAEVHNLYALLEARATFEGMLAAAPARRPFVLSRAGFAGIQRYAAVWTGDAPSRFDTLQGTLPMLVGLGLSGVAFAGSDVGGYSGAPGPELFARWMALGSISPFFRGHVTTGAPDQEPWSFGREIEAISREHIRRRYRLLPYLYSLFHLAHETGAPVLRPMVHEFQEDRAVQTIGDQAMLGPWILVAPVLEAGASERTIYLPSGTWFELESGAARVGPGRFRTSAPLASLPMFVREGAILPSGDDVTWTGETTARDHLDVYPAAVPSAFEAYEDDGATPESASSRIRYRLVKTATGATLLAGPSEGRLWLPRRPLVVHVRRVDAPPTRVAVSGVAIAALDRPAALETAREGYWYDANERALHVALPRRDDFTLAIAYDAALRELAPPVRVPLRVRLPPGTPADATIHVATSLSGWAQEAMARGTDPAFAEGTVEAPRGAWFEYKYTRGDWSTVEKWAGCVEATNRSAIARASPAREDRVDAWADACR